MTHASAHSDRRPLGLLASLFARLGTTITVDTTPDEFVFRSPRGEFRARPVLHLSGPDKRSRVLAVGATPPSTGPACEVNVWSPPMYPGFERSGAELMALFLMEGFSRVTGARAMIRPRVFFPDIASLAAVATDPKSLLVDAANRAGAREAVFHVRPEDGD